MQHLDQTRKPKRVWLHNIAIFYVPKKVQGKKWSCQSLGSTNKYHMTQLPIIFGVVSVGDCGIHFGGMVHGVFCQVNVVKELHSLK